MTLGVDSTDTCLYDDKVSDVKVRDVLRMLIDDGWSVVRTKGSHRQLHHSSKPGTVTVAGKLNIDVPPGTPKSILRQAGLGEQT